MNKSSIRISIEIANYGNIKAKDLRHRIQIFKNALIGKAIHTLNKSDAFDLCYDLGLLESKYNDDSNIIEYVNDIKHHGNLCQEERVLSRRNNIDVYNDNEQEIKETQEPEPEPEPEPKQEKKKRICLFSYEPDEPEEQDEFTELDQMLEDIDKTLLEAENMTKKAILEVKKDIKPPTNQGEIIKEMNYLQVLHTTPFKRLKQAKITPFLEIRETFKLEVTLKMTPAVKRKKKPVKSSKSSKSGFEIFEFEGQPYQARDLLHFNKVVRGKLNHIKKLENEIKELEQNKELVNLEMELTKFQEELKDELDEDEDDRDEDEIKEFENAIRDIKNEIKINKEKNKITISKIKKEIKKYEKEIKKFKG